MINNDKYPVFSEYDFIRLYCALTMKKYNQPLLKHKELEKKLYKLYNSLEYRDLFEDIVADKDYDVDDNHLLLTSAIQTAQTFGLLVSIQDSGDIKSIISLDSKQIDEIISSYTDEVVTKMSNLLENIDQNQEFTVLAVPCKRAFVVSPDKTEAFLNLKPNPEIRRQQEEIAETFRKNNLVEDKPKVKNLGQKTDKK